MLTNKDLSFLLDNPLMLNIHLMNSMGCCSPIVNEVKVNR